MSHLSLSQLQRPAFAVNGELVAYDDVKVHFLWHHEVPNSVRAVLFRDAPVAPSVPLVDAGATARTDLGSGEVLDGLVGFATHGLPENHVIVGRREQSNQLDDASEVPR